MTFTTQASRWNIFLLPMRIRASYTIDQQNKSKARDKVAHVDSRPVHYVRFKTFVDALYYAIGYSLEGFSRNKAHKSKSSYLYNNSRWYTMAQQFVKFRSDFHYPRWRLLLHNQIRDFVAVCLPVGFSYRQWAR